MDSSADDQRSSPLKAETRLVTAGRDTEAQKGFVNPPVVHGSTVLYPTADDLHAHRGEYQYGRRGTPTTKALQQALMAIPVLSVVLALVLWAGSKTIDDDIERSRSAVLESGAAL